MSDIKFTFADSKLQAKIRALRSSVKSVDMMKATQDSMLQLLTTHIAWLATSRRNSFGAPSSHYDTSKIYPAGVTDDSAVIAIGIPGISRAYHDITIRPRNGKYLTIPVSPIAYGHRVGDLRSSGYNIFRPKGKNVLGISGPDNTFVALYALATRVTQKQDPTLLPDEEELEAAFVHGCKTYIKTLTQLKQ